MKYIPIIILLVVFLLSCGDNSKPQPSAVDDDGVEELYNRDKADSVCEVILEKANEEVEIEKQPSSKLKGNYKDPEYDNMRGFDPASEDDMPDNGMSRYMENNDEEGWD